MAKGGILPMAEIGILYFTIHILRILCKKWYAFGEFLLILLDCLHNSLYDNCITNNLSEFNTRLDICFSDGKSKKYMKYLAFSIPDIKSVVDDPQKEHIHRQIPAYCQSV